MVYIAIIMLRFIPTRILNIKPRTIHTGVRQDLANMNRDLVKLARRSGLSDEEIRDLLEDALRVRNGNISLVEKRAKQEGAGSDAMVASVALVGIALMLIYLINE